MTFQTSRPVVSGTPHRIRQVRGRIPRRLADFADQTSFIRSPDGEDYDVRGPGIEIERLVRVFEKDELGLGKDIRVWTARRHADGELFTTEQTPV